MSAPPFMPLYVGDYLSDTRHLSTEQHGAYMLLLMAMWRAGGRLPNEAAKLARITGLTPAKWAKLEAEILAFFDVSGDEIGHKRIEKEFEKYTRTCAKRAEAGARGGKAKALKNNVVDLASARILPEPGHKPGHSNQNQNQNIGSKSPTSEKAETQQNGQAVRRGFRLPPDWLPSGEGVVYALSQGFGEADVLRIGEDFRDYWTAKTGGAASKLDWDATWRRWVREEAKRRAKRPSQGPPKRVGFV